MLCFSSGAERAAATQHGHHPAGGAGGDGPGEVSPGSGGGCWSLYVSVGGGSTVVVCTFVWEAAALW